MAIVSGVIVTVFGGLTLFLHDETFIKVKPTIIYALFGVTLLAGLIFRKPLLEMVFDSVFNLTEEGWRKLTLRWALFFFFMAVLNEMVWRTQSTDVWVSFKLFGAVPLTFLFAALQYPLLMQHDANPEAAKDSESAEQSLGRARGHASERSAPIRSSAIGIGAAASAFSIAGLSTAW